MKLLFCHGPPSWISPRRASTLCNIHEVILLSPPSILDLTKQSLDPVQYSWSYSFVTALHLGFHHVEPWPCAIFMKLLFCHGPPSWIWPSRASTLYIIHEVTLLSPPSILHLTTQSLDPVQHPWGYSFLSQPSILDFTMQSLNPVQCTWGLFFCRCSPSWMSPRKASNRCNVHEVILLSRLPSWISPRKASTRCNIHEVCLLSRPAILDFTTQLHYMKNSSLFDRADNSSPVVANRAENSNPG